MNIGGKHTALAKKLRAHLESCLNDKTAGISAAIMVGGEVAASCCAGTRGVDRTCADIGDLYNVGSISKVYCAAAVMKLVEMGLVGLDDPVCRHLPRFKTRDERYKDITVRMTLNHSSGLPGSNYRKTFGPEWIFDDSLEESFAYWQDCKLKADPGAFSVYCNEGFELAAALVEQLTGMKYYDFLRREILDPIGASSTGVAMHAIGSRRLMSALGKKPELVSVVGAGAIRTDMEDCARFGQLFLEPNGVLSAQSIAEMSAKQGVTFLKNDCFGANYGLGWDSVSFHSPYAELGPGTLTKGGGTTQFSSQLIVSPSYGVSAAISATPGFAVSPTDILCQMISITLKDLGIADITPASGASKAPADVPQDVAERYNRYFYSSYGIFRPEFEGSRMRMRIYCGGGKWDSHPRLPEMQYDGERFFCDSGTGVFEDYGGVTYYITPLLDDICPFCQTAPTLPPLSDGWRARLGKKYLACNLPSRDFFQDSGHGVIVEQPFDSGVLSFTQPSTPDGPQSYLVAASCGDDDTDMFQTTPGMGARDQYAPFIIRRAGVEYLQITGFIYVDADTLPTLCEGDVYVSGENGNAQFRLPDGCRPHFSVPAGARVLILNSKLEIVYNSDRDAAIPDGLGEGYILFTSDLPTVIPVSLT